MDRDCAHCGRPLGAGKTLGRKAKYCSDACRSTAGNARISDARAAELEAEHRKCEHCSEPLPSTKRVRFCNMQCTLAARNAREHADRWVVKESLDRRCDACGAALPTRHPLGTKHCNRHCKDVAKVARLRSEARAVIEAMNRRCEQCGVAIDVDAPLAGWPHKFCTLQCCAQWYEPSSRRARAAQKPQEVQEVRRCAHCDNAVPSTARSDARYCSRSCKELAKNRRR